MKYNDNCDNHDHADEHDNDDDTDDDILFHLPLGSNGLWYGAAPNKQTVRGTTKALVGWNRHYHQYHYLGEHSEAVLSSWRSSGSLYFASEKSESDCV